MKSIPPRPCLRGGLAAVIRSFRLSAGSSFTFTGIPKSELMEATGLKKGGIYRHFSSKEELAAEAFDYAWKEALDIRMHDL